MRAVPRGYFSMRPFYGHMDYFGSPVTRRDVTFRNPLSDLFGRDVV